MPYWVNNEPDAVRLSEESALRSPIRAAEERAQIWVAVIPAHDHSMVRADIATSIVPNVGFHAERHAGASKRTARHTVMNRDEQLAKDTRVVLVRPPDEEPTEFSAFTHEVLENPFVAL